MSKNKLFSIITIICFCSIILIPIGLALMFFSTNWKKTLKIILTASLSTLYIFLFVLFLLLEPSVNKSGTVLPFDYSQGKTKFNTEVPSSSKKLSEQEEEFKTKTHKKTDSKKEDKEVEHLPRSLRKVPGKGGTQIFFTILYVY